MHPLNITCCIKHGLKHKFIMYRENKLIVTKYVQNVHHWHEHKHKHASVFAIGQLRDHQSATAPSRATHAVDASELISVMNSGLTHVAE